MEPLKLSDQLRDVISAVTSTGSDVTPLNRHKVAQRWIELCATFGVDGDQPGKPWLWAVVEEKAARHISDPEQAFETVAKLVGERQCLLFFEDHFGPVLADPEIPCHAQLTCVEIVGRKALAAALNETYWEICVSDPSYRWALMLNHHDYLIGIGEAQQWVEGLTETVD